MADPTTPTGDARRRVFLGLPAGYYQMSDEGKLKALEPFVDALLGEDGLVG